MPCLCVSWDGRVQVPSLLGLHIFLFIIIIYIVSKAIASEFCLKFREVVV